MADTTYRDWPFLEDRHRAHAAALEAWAAVHVGMGVHPHSDVDDECRELVRKLGQGGWLAAGPNFAHAMTKKMLDQEWDMSVDEAIEAEAQAQAICMQTRDFERAYRAFVAKQTPVFEGT